MKDVLQVLGAVLIVVPFAATQLGRMGPASIAYLVLNLVGSLMLGWLALDRNQWGFVLLETVWACVSAWSLLGITRGRPPAAGAH